MKRPLAPGTPIDAKRYKRWISRFGSYREPIINVTINSWLENFEDEDQFDYISAYVNSIGPSDGEANDHGSSRPMQMANESRSTGGYI